MPEIENGIVLKKFIMCHALIENCHECLNCYDENTNPTERKKISQPTEMPLLDRNPTIKDFGKMVQKVGKLNLKFAKIQIEVSEALIENESIDKNKIQHMMNYSRYMAVLNKIMSNFILPINNDPNKKFILYRKKPGKLNSNL